MAEYKVLIHISDRDKWSSTLTMCLNLARETAADALELVILADIFAGAVCVACDRNLRKLMNELVELRTVAAEPQSSSGSAPGVHWKGPQFPLRDHSKAVRRVSLY
jgi:hypothetical protein